VEAFGPPNGTGFLSELSNDLSTLIFSTYLGDTHTFQVQSVAIGSGAAFIGGDTLTSGNSVLSNVYVNRIATAPPPALRIDSILNAASIPGGAVTPGETIFIRGAGFGADSIVSIGGMGASPLAIDAAQLTVAIPANLPFGDAIVAVQSGGSASNQVLVPVTSSAPGIYSLDGNGLGQAVAFNRDGKPNSPSNPAAPGNPVTIYVTGTGPVSIVDGYAVTASLPNVTIGGFYANGVSATIGPAPGFLGDVYQITVFVPAELANLTLPKQASVMIRIAGAASQQGIEISVGH
jgi:uncharacterized protein (TIGR03437 family)